MQISKQCVLTNLVFVWSSQAQHREVHLFTEAACHLLNQLLRITKGNKTYQK